MIDGTYSTIPEHVSGALVRYVAWGLTPGSALGAVLSNDLKEAVAYSDDDSWEAVREVVSWLYNFAPSTCYGSREKFVAWSKTDLSDFGCLKEGLEKFSKDGCTTSQEALTEIFG